MKKFREDKGITLIALIITIVVLLILAVVAIGQAQETNIVGYAQNASSKYAEGQGEEVNMISSYESLMENMMSPWSKLTVPVQFDKKYSNYITIDGETEFIEVIIYSNGGMNWLGEDVEKYEIEEACNEGYLKITSNAIDLDGLKLEFSKDGYKINLYLEGDYIGVLDTEEKEQTTSTWSAYGTTQAYALINNDTNIAYYVYEGQNYGVFNIVDGSVAEYNNGKYSDYEMDSYVRNASKIMTTNTSVVGVIAQNGNVYMLAVNTGEDGKGKILATEFVLNNSIDYSSILEQIQ